MDGPNIRLGSGDLDRLAAHLLQNDVRQWKPICRDLFTRVAMANRLPGTGDPSLQSAIARLGRAPLDAAIMNSTTYLHALETAAHEAYWFQTLDEDELRDWINAMLSRPEAAA